MVKTEDSWLFQQHSDWDLPNVNYMSRLVPTSQKIIAPSCVNPCTFSANVPFLGFSSPALKTGQENDDFSFLNYLPPLLEGSLSPSNPFLCEPQFALPHRLGIKTMPNYVSSSSQTRFLIVDQSENHARFFRSSFGSSSQIPISMPMKPVNVCPARGAEQVPMMEHIFPIKPTVQGAYLENPTLGEESEFHEDSEEIDALLYSDDDENDYNDGDDGEDGEDGEVTSTYQSPFPAKVNPENYEEEVASSDSSTKRQRLLNGGYKKSSFVDSTMKFDRPCEYNNDAELSCARAKTKGKVMDSLQLRKDKIHEKVRILETIIPGSKSKEPLVIIDEAISYLKSLKLKAKAMGLGYP